MGIILFADHEGGVLAGSALKERQVSFDMLWREGDPVDDDIEGVAGKHISHARIANVSVQHMRALRRLAIALTAIQ